MTLTETVTEKHANGPDPIKFGPGNWTAFYSGLDRISDRSALKPLRLFDATDRLGSPFSMKKMITIIGAAAMAAAFLAGCSDGGAPTQQAGGEVTVSTPPDETPTPAETQSADFATAVKFTKLVHQSKYKPADALVVPESPAARYLAHQTLITKAEEIAGFDQSTDEEPRFKPGPGYGQHQDQVREDEGRACAQLRLEGLPLRAGQDHRLDRCLRPRQGCALDAYHDRLEAQHEGQAGVGLSLKQRQSANRGRAVGQQGPRVR
jgi:hypothetical protein